MKKRTLEVLTRVQAVRLEAARRQLGEAARADRATRSAAERLVTDRAAVLRDFGPRAEDADVRLSLHATRYAELLAARREEMAPELERTDHERRDARQLYAKALAREQVLARRR